MRTTLLAIALALSVAGCGAPAFRAGSLPPNFRTVQRTPSGAINLAGIAAPGGGESQINGGDLLEVTVASGRDDETVTPVATRVSDSGAADIPLIGPVQVGGLEPFEASQAVAQAAVERGIFLRPHVTLEIKTRAVNRVTVMGAVEEPGVHKLPRSSSDLVKALAMAGGLTADAGTVVEIIRQPSPETTVAGAANDQLMPASYQYGGAAPMAGPQVIRVDLASSQAALADFRLGDRDMVMVKPRDKEMLSITGLVNKPGQYELPANQEVRLLDAIALGGGLSSTVADRVLVIRHVAGRPEPIPIQASLRIAKRDGRENLVLGPGDVVSVEQTPATAVVDAFMKLFRMSVGLAGRSTVF
jgi:polysaccharide export outer membrane protein